ncbi:MAG: hypothetical protein KGD64_15405, partial [Candidatus Heimdallarchaeota archaeon]|nr:hypothetical protein [Candidatus Heimdallarchaeota archaeon]
NYSTLSIILFIVSLFIIAGVNLLGIAHLQDAFKHGDASKIYPIGQIPVQIAPVILFYGIYLKNSPQAYSIYLLLTGIVIILFAGFLLGRKQGQLELMGLDKEHENKSTDESEIIEES